MLPLAEHEKMMRIALRLARLAGRNGEVPVGALVVRDGRVLGAGCNQRETKHDPVAHAEIQAIRRAARRIGSWRLDRCVLYVTMEPCAMCAGACVNARIAKIFYGCADRKAGYVDSLGSIATDTRLNHRCEVVSGLLGPEAAEVLRTFFRARRSSADPEPDGEPRRVHGEADEPGGRIEPLEEPGSLDRGADHEIGGEKDDRVTNSAAQVSSLEDERK